MEKFFIDRIVYSCEVEILLLFFSLLALLMIISLPSSRFHVILGFGTPRALHSNVAGLFSIAVVSVLVAVDMISGGTTTSRKTFCKIMWNSSFNYYGRILQSKRACPYWRGNVLQLVEREHDSIQRCVLRVSTFDGI